MSEGFPKTALKTPEQQLMELRDLQRALIEAREAQDAPAAEALMKGNWDLVFSREAADISFEEAERLLGKDFLGPKTVEKIFGNMPETVPDIPFSKAELQRAKELGQQLIFYTDALPPVARGEKFAPLTLENLKQKFPKAHDGNPTWYSQDWYENEEFFKSERPRTGWRLTSKDLIPGSVSKNYLEQTDVLIEHLTKEVFKGISTPKEYSDAIREFNKERPNIARLMESDWQKTSQALVDLKITKLVRELPIEVMYRLILNDQANKDKPLPSTYTWTASRDSDGNLVLVGDFDVTGARVHGGSPGARYGALGVSFSRS